jgi:hypothetical protein
MKVHELKTVQPHFDQVQNGQKTFELRKNDRGFEWDDILILKEYNPKSETYTGDYMVAKVIHILKNFPGIDPDYCILSIKKLD